MSKAIDIIVKEKAKEIRELLGTTSILFGEPVDLNNPDQVIVAVWYAAQQELVKQKNLDLPWLKSN